MEGVGGWVVVVGGGGGRAGVGGLIRMCTYLCACLDRRRGGWLDGATAAETARCRPD